MKRRAGSHRRARSSGDSGRAAPSKPSDVDERAWAVVQGFRRRYRENVVQFFNRILAAVMVVGGLAAAIA